MTLEFTGSGVSYIERLFQFNNRVLKKDHCRETERREWALLYLMGLCPDKLYSRVVAALTGGLFTFFTPAVMSSIAEIS